MFSLAFSEKKLIWYTQKAQYRFFGVELFEIKLLRRFRHEGCILEFEWAIGKS